ncbi:MAG: YceD family protein [Candidatus Lernaella stagnicola]|nr:YceD family protein [Candidatus Lernaella stagnicola]
MKILIHRISEPGDAVEFSVPGSLLRQWLGGQGSIIRCSDCVARLRLERLDQLVSIRGTAAFGMRFVCGRCGGEFDADLSVPVEMVLSPRPGDGLEAVEDIGTGYHNGRQIDLGRTVLEQVALAMPEVLLCDSDCKGVATDYET